MSEKKSIVVIAHDIRSAHNIGSLFRTCDGLGIDKLYLTGYCPYPQTTQDQRLPHVAMRAHKQIAKTALGAESSMPWKHCADIKVALQELIDDGYVIAALEQSNKSIDITNYSTPNKIALLLGSEVNGIDPNLLRDINVHLEIPMFGKKESFNVAAAASMALFYFRFN
jgi:tRNA G18 (ribose-2'-O)-methylase SpoU